MPRQPLRGASRRGQRIRRHGLGLVLTEGNLDEVADALHRLLEDASALAMFRANARRAYFEEFSKRVVNDRWDGLLRRRRATGRRRERGEEAPAEPEIEVIGKGEK